LIRYAQEVYPVYGRCVRAFEITKLTVTDYEERMLGDKPVLSAGTSAWNCGGMHHVDAHRLENGTWISCVDGFAWRNQ
jgi:hypothetical protein